MKATYTNRVMSSFLLWFNYTLQQKGQAFINYTTIFYPTNQIYNGLYAYASPFNQLISDSSITGATVITGVYLNGFFVTTGVSGFHGIDYEHGRALFTTPVPASVTISGVLSYKEVNVSLTNAPEEEILFETKFNIRARAGQIPTGLWTNQLSYPLVFIKKYMGKNQPFAFGGQDNTVTRLSAIVLADNMFTLDSISSIFEDQVRTTIPYLDTGDFPFNVYGEFINSSGYNFQQLSQGKDYLFVDDVTYTPFRTSLYTEIRTINPEIFLGIIDFSIFKNRFPRQET